MDLIWRLKPKREDADYLQLTIDYANNRPVNLNDFKVEQIGSIIFSFRNEIEKHILDHGLSSLIGIQPLNEQLIAKGESENKIVTFFQKYLDKVGIDNELIIVDPYFYAPTSNANYHLMINSLLAPYIANITTLKIITFPGGKISPPVKVSVESTLIGANPHLAIEHKTSNDYHDRFLISNNREKGIIVGTSFNGLGNKYALIDRLNTSDVREIVSSLISNGLL
ncbi:MAG TPA: hypothetical protein PK637_00935 [Flavobacteriales bacterium]|nr:hypothetical protein [Flavobacteriales bacterium]HRE95297.1 hypothetical protein [Flavobacteriales bacterium]HRJ37225.1 hypothetical protein [Flavobacteriales bacterium]